MIMVYEKTGLKNGIYLQLTVRVPGLLTISASREMYFNFFSEVGTGSPKKYSKLGIF
jgi:hypothetical protein